MVKNEEKFFPVKRVISYDRCARGVDFRCFCSNSIDAFISIKFITPEIVRFVLSVEEGHQEEKSPSVVLERPKEFTVDITENEDFVNISSDHLEVHVGLDPWTLEYRSAAGKLLTKELGDDKDVLDNWLTKPLGFTAQCDQGEGLKKILRTHLSLLARSDECFYGFGEKFTPFEKSGQKITMWNKDALGTRTEDSYKNIPFFLSTKGYGFFLDETGKSTFHVKDLSARACGMDLEHGGLDYYLIYGSTPLEIIENYTKLTGRPSLPPCWSFGLWLSTYFEKADEASVRNQTDKMRELEIPCDVYHFDCYWLREKMWNDFTWNREAFPYPENLIGDLHEKGYKISLWENPYVSIKSDLYQEGKKRGYFLKGENGKPYHAQMWHGLQPPTAIVDFTNPEAVEWYKEIHRALIDMGVDVFKTDFGEDIPEDALFFNGEKGKKIHNLYALLYNKAVFEVTEEKKGEGLVWARSGWAGSQRYPTHWSGDPHSTWEDMASVLRGGLSFSMSGMSFWSHDIGGFAGKPTERLYIRWAQFGLLSSHSRLHGWSNRDPWNFGEKALGIFKKFAQLRYRLLPYIFSYAVEAQRTGHPLMRPMVMEFPEDPATYHLDQQYMLGSELLVVPVLSPDDIVFFYLPKGKWYDFWTGEVIEGGSYTKRVVPLDSIPLFVPSGSILPMGKPMNYVGEKKSGILNLRVYLGDKPIQFQLSDDRRRILLECVEEDGTLRFTADEQGHYILSIYGADSPTKVKVDGTKVKKVNWDDWEENKHQWACNKRGKIVVGNISKTAELCFDS